MKNMALHVAVLGIVIGFSLWVLGKVLTRIGDAMERWGDRH
jgi:hypothetical protein